MLSGKRQDDKVHVENASYNKHKHTNAYMHFTAEIV